MSDSTDDLPREYDAIVLGTGMTECIIAAALSRIGQKVLHLDRNDYYSGDWGTFHTKGIQEWIQNLQEQKGGIQVKDVEVSELLKEGEKAVKLKVNSDSIYNVVHHTYISKSLEEPKTEGTVQKVSGENTAEDTTIADGPVEDNSDSKESETSETTELEQATAGGAEKAESAKTPSQKKNNVAPDIPKQPEWSLDKLDKEFRKFNIDLHPRILFSRGPMVELLISSDIAKYCEFRTITRILTQLDDKLEQVPCSRSDVFSSKRVTMIEKRMLMKLLNFCLKYDNPEYADEYAGFENKTFVEFLKSKKLTKNVCHYVQHAIAMVTDTATTLEGLKATQRFLQSLGRYGNTAFLWPLYGSGELPQCFCRMCAVFGGTYCLRRTGTELIVDNENKCKGIVDTEGVRLEAKWLIAESSYLENDFFQTASDVRSISRGILLTDKSILDDGQKHISMLSIPGDEENLCTVLELSSSSLACPEGIHMVHLSCRGKTTAKEDLKQLVELLFQSLSEIEDHGADESKPKILWSLFFNQRDTSRVEENKSLPENLFVVGGPDLALDFDYCIEKAKAVFCQICPGEEFLPKAPNPEDIILDDGTTASNEGSGFETAQADAENPMQNSNSDSKDEAKTQESEFNAESLEENTKKELEPTAAEAEDPEKEPSQQKEGTTPSA